MEKNERNERNESEENSLERQQLAVMKQQLRYSRITTAVSCAILVVVLCGGFLLIPKLNKVLEDVNLIVRDLQEADLSEMVENINELSIVSQEGITNATEKLDSVDLESLNQAIQDLSKIISPLAKLVDGFSK